MAGGNRANAEAEALRVSSYVLWNAKQIKDDERRQRIGELRYEITFTSPPSSAGSSNRRAVEQIHECPPSLAA